MNLLKSLIVALILTGFSFESKSENQHEKDKERIKIYFTNDVEEAREVSVSLIYNTDDFKRTFGDLNSLSDMEKESVYEKVFNKMINETSGCQTIAERTTLVTSLKAIHRQCESMEEVSPTEEYEGVSCHCVYQSASGEILYLRKID